MAKKNDYTDLVALAESSPGWTVKQRNDKLFFYPPSRDFKPVVAGLFDRDRKARLNTVARLRRAGLKAPK